MLAANTYLLVLNLVTIIVNYKGQWKSRIVFAMAISS